MQKPSGDQIVKNSTGPDLAGEFKQAKDQKKNLIEKIQEIDGQMKELAKQVIKKVKKLSIYELSHGLPYCSPYCSCNA